VEEERGALGTLKRARVLALLAFLLLSGVLACAAQTHHHPETGLLGGYAASRDASGTSWQPEAAGMEGWHFRAGPWSFMVHGFVNAVFSDQGGPRGVTEGYFTNMLMGLGARPLGGARLGLRAMVALEPALGPEGYPLLLQTGETADGRTNLVDRQHPHDAFMELAASLGIPVGGRSSLFLYFGLPGEPALGPPSFMHRPSGVDLPDSPLGHHWMDVTHVSFGVATLGFVAGPVKLDASAFNGREPDEHRWGIEGPRFSSFSARLTVNPSPGLSIQASAARLESPEILHPGVDVTRTSVSVSYSRKGWNTTAIWGRNERSANLTSSRFTAYSPRRATDAWLLESSVRLGRAHTVFGRAEQADKDELFPVNDPFHSRVFPVGKVEAGYVWDVLPRSPLVPGLGLAVGVHFLPEFLEPDYGRRPKSLLVFARLKLR
jgi:hypothetical protein